MFLDRWRRALNSSLIAGAKLVALDKSISTVEFYPDGTIADANENFLALMGYSLREIVGHDHSIFVDEEERQSQDYAEFWKRLSKNPLQTAEYKRFGKGGRLIWIRATYSPVRNLFGKTVRILKCVTDITAAKTQTADFSGQIDAINKSQAIIQFDLNGVIVGVNDVFLNAVGYRKDEIIGQHHSLFVAPEEAESWQYSNFWQKLREGGHQSAEFRRLGKDGREVWLQASYNPIFDTRGKPFKVVKYATVITQDKLRNAGYASEIEAINRSQCVIEFDMDGFVLGANENFLATLGYRPAEVIGRHHEMFVSLDYAASREYQEFWQKLRRGEFHSAVYTRLGKNGREVFIQATYSPIRDLNGRLCKVVKYATDITDEVIARRSAVVAAQETSLRVLTVASAVEQMSVSIEEISRNMSASRQLVDVMYQDAASAEHHTNALKHATEAMDSVVGAISRITAQINLLALNATIESARAGEAGKGFTTVANEVKVLANKAAESTKLISDQINAVQQVSADVIGRILNITKSIGSVQDYVSRSAVSMELQSDATREITVNMNEVAQNVSGISKTLADVA